MEGAVEAASCLEVLEQRLQPEAEVSLAISDHAQGCKDGHRPMDQQSSVIEMPVSTCSHNLFYQNATVVCSISRS
jgi:hypothetical protein